MPPWSIAIATRGEGARPSLRMEPARMPCGPRKVALAGRAGARSSPKLPLLDADVVDKGAVSASVVSQHPAAHVRAAVRRADAPRVPGDACMLAAGSREPIGSEGGPSGVAEGKVGAGVSGASSRRRSRRPARVPLPPRLWPRSESRKRSGFPRDTLRNGCRPRGARRPPRRTFWRVTRHKLTD